MQRYSLLPLLVLGLITVPVLAQGPVGDLYSTDASVRGSVLFASGGMRIASGSTVTAGDTAASLHLARGGEVRICPATQVSVTSSGTGNELMMAMNTGSLEAHYELKASADTVLTPDFRILLAGPGLFHFAISSDSRGNACVKSLSANTASLIVTELNGDGTYQVKSNEEIMFKGGKVDDVDHLVPPNCGCPPAPTVPMKSASAEPPKPPQVEAPAPAVAQPTVAAAPPPPSFVPVSATVPSANERPADKRPQEVHLQFEAPFVYQAGNAEDELALSVARLRLTSGSMLPTPLGFPPPPPAAAQVQVVQKEDAPAPVSRKKAMFKRFKSFLGYVFN